MNPTALEPISVQPPNTSTQLEAPVTRVTLLEDRAQVTRQGRLRLAAGNHRLEVPDVSPVLADRTVLARSQQARIDESRVVRRWRIGASERPANAAELGLLRAQMASTLQHKQAVQTLKERDRSLNEQALSLLLQGINRELPYLRKFVSQWPTDVETFCETIRKLDQSVLTGSLELRDLHSRLQAIDLQLSSTGRLDHILATSLEIEVRVEAEAEVEISVEYMVPCALWRPIHRATLSTPESGGARVRWECEGAVWQATGEDWNDIQLHFSTARSTQQAEPPDLHDDLLRAQRKVEKKTEVSVREEVIARTGEAQTTSDLPGVDDGGETRLLPASTRASILSNGRLYRIPVFTFETQAEIERVARPELSPQVHLRSKQVNPSKTPLMAGPVELLRNSGYVGRGTCEYVAPQEKFAFGWGPESALRVQRTQTEKREPAKLLGKQSITRTIELFLSNLDDRPAGFRLEERIPVSELESVTIAIDNKETSPAAKADDQGIVAWNLELPAHGTQKVKLVYKITAASDVQGL